MDRSTEEALLLDELDEEFDGETVMQQVQRIKKQVEEGIISADEVKPFLYDLAELMVQQIINTSEKRLDEFINTVEREVTILEESRPNSAATKSVTSASRPSTRLSDSSIHNLLAGFLTDLTESVSMHLEDMLDENLVHVVEEFQTILPTNEDVADKEREQ